MATMSFGELNELLHGDEEYVAAEKELRPDFLLANDVISLRVDKGWSQVDLARQVGTNQANVSRLETGRANPTLRFLKKLALALGAELEVRLRGVDDQPDGNPMDQFVAHLTPELKTDASMVNGERATWPSAPLKAETVAISIAAELCR